MQPTQQALIPFSWVGTYSAGSAAVIELNPDFQYVVTNVLFTPSSDAGQSYILLELIDGDTLLEINLGADGLTTCLDTQVVLPVLSELQIYFSGATEAYGGFSGFAMSPDSTGLLAP